jgi:Zn-dependent protease
MVRGFSRPFLTVFTLIPALPLYGGKLVFAILMTWFEGEFVFHHVYLFPFDFLLHFLHTQLSKHRFTCYTSLYLVDYAYHCARVSRNVL